MNAENWRLYNPEDKKDLSVYDGDMDNGMRSGFDRLTAPKEEQLDYYK